METTLTIVFALLGLAIGSFLNVCIDRLPVGKSLVSPPSHCDSCHHPLSVPDLIPVLSYIWLRGRCRYCQARIPLRPLWVEIIGGLLLAVSYWYHGLSVDFAVIAIYSYLFMVILFIDWEHQLILNKITYPAAVAALIISFFHPPPGVIHISLPWPIVAEGISGIINSLIGGGAGFILFLIPILIYPGGMGWGDVKLAGLIGLTLGFPLAIIALFIGIVIGGLAAIILLLSKRKGRKDVIPYGAFLAPGAIITLFCGGAILNWYLSLL